MFSAVPARSGVPVAGAHWCRRSDRRTGRVRVLGASCSSVPHSLPMPPPVPSVLTAAHDGVRVRRSDRRLVDAELGVALVAALEVHLHAVTAVLRVGAVVRLRALGAVLFLGAIRATANGGGDSAQRHNQRGGDHRREPAGPKRLRVVPISPPNVKRESDTHVIFSKLALRCVAVDFTFSAEQDALRDVARSFLAAQAPSTLCAGNDGRRARRH